MRERDNNTENEKLSRKEKRRLRKDKKKEKRKDKAEWKKEEKKLSYEDRRGILLIAVLAVVVIALGGYCMKADDEKKAETTTQPASVVQTTAAAPVTAAPVTQAAVIQTTQPPVVTEKKEKATEKVSEKVTQKPAKTETTKKQEPKNDSQQEILDTVAKAVNSLKSDKASFKSKRTQVVNLTLTECSVPVLTDAVNKGLELLAGEDVLEFDFTDGKGINPKDGEEVTTLNMIPPTDKPFTLTMEGVAKAEKYQSEKGTVYSVTVVPETSTLENTKPPHHSAAGDALNFAAFELPVGEITMANFKYPGATISVTLDDSGRVVEYHERLPMSGGGEGKALGITASGTMEGYMDELWIIEWK